MLNLVAESEMEATASVDGFTYELRVEQVGAAYKAHLTWRRFGIPNMSERRTEQVTPLFNNPRSAMIEGHALAEEYILAWRS